MSRINSLYGNCYNEDYPGVYEMIVIDYYSKLHKWFHNYITDRSIQPPSKYEWMTIEEIRSISPRGKEIINYIGTIGADHQVDTRTVRFETNAPPPPTFMQPAKEKYIPPTPAAIMEAFNRISKFMEQRDLKRQWNSLSEQQRKTAQELPAIKVIPTYRRNQ